jgi:hypothetical protein
MKKHARCVHTEESVGGIWRGKRNKNPNQTGKSEQEAEMKYDLASQYDGRESWIVSEELRMKKPLRR